jgi:hypothetical protein
MMLKSKFRYLILFIILIALSACSTPEQTPEPVTRKTLPPTWTEAPTSTPSLTPVPPTPTPTATPTIPTNPSGGEPQVHSIVHSSGLLIGGIVDSSWVTAEEIAPYLEGRRTYQLVTQNAVKVKAWGQISTPPDGFTCPDRVYIDFPGVNPGVFSYAIEGDWNPLPRTPVKLDTDSPYYKDLVKDRIKTNGVGSSPVQIQEIQQIDLEGDGANEIIINASYYQNKSGIPSVMKGDYSLVILSQVIGDETVDLPLFQSFELSNREDGVPAYVRSVRLFDLNGDGVMEILVSVEYHDATQVFVYELSDATQSPVLAIFCVTPQ